MFQIFFFPTLWTFLKSLSNYSLVAQERLHQRAGGKATRTGASTGISSLRCACTAAGWSSGGAPRGWWPQEAEGSRTAEAPLTWLRRGPWDANAVISWERRFIRQPIKRLWRLNRFVEFCEWWERDHSWIFMKRYMKYKLYSSILLFCIYEPNKNERAHRTHWLANTVSVVTGAHTKAQQTPCRVEAVRLQSI